MSSKYYWLKLKRDFFKRHDIRIVEGMSNGKEYILFYLKLLCESVDHDGNLRFSDQIPYNEDMLAIITDTNVDVVRGAVKVFTELKMMEILDDGTIFMAEVEGMIGAETEWARKKREYRATLFRNEPPLIEGQTEDNVLTMSDKSKSKSKSIEKDINTYSSETFSSEVKEEAKDGYKKDKQFASECAEIIEYLNSKVGTHYRNVDSNNKYISGRLRDGFTVQDCKDVIDKKCAEWMGSDMQQFLRPKTLFAPSNFEGYLYAPTKTGRKGNIVIPMPDYMQKQVEELDAMHKQIDKEQLLKDIEEMQSGMKGEPNE